MSPVEPPAGPVRLPLLRDLRRARLAVCPPSPAERAAGADAGRAYRRRLADLTDAALTELWTHAAGASGLDPAAGAALAAVGSLGRRDGGPTADLDLLLVHDGLAEEELAALSRHLWYPIWDARLSLDHSVRTLGQCRRVASADLPAAVGLLHLRTVAGDRDLGERTAAAVLADWRSAARTRLEDLLASIEERVRRHGELAYLIEPDLKESRGGLRDAVVVEALVASWLTDRSHGPLDEARAHLLDVRDALAGVTGRSTTVLRLAEQDEVAARLGITGTGAVVDRTPAGREVHDPADDLLAGLAQASRTVAAALDDALRRAEQHVRSRRRGLRGPVRMRGRRRPPRLPELASGLVEHEGEVVLAAEADPADSLLALRAAAAACRTGLPLSPSARASLGAAPVPGAPWPAEARGLLLEVLASGTAQLPVWEVLDLAGVVTRWLPEWTAVRNRPQRTAVHRFTVDRHLVETVAGIPATAPAGAVEREDLLLLAALLHDIGKTPGAVDHCAEGVRVAAPLLCRLGLDAAERELVLLLIRHHLLLPELATTRDPAAPAVAAEVARVVRHDREILTMLRRLTEADARAAGPQAWTSWRARLVDRLVAHAAASLGPCPPAAVDPHR